MRSALVPANGYSIGTIRQLAEGARVRRLSFFDTPLAATYTRERLPVVHPPITTGILQISSGATLHGNVFLVDHFGDESYRVRSVKFLIAPSGSGPTVTVSAVQFSDGWLGGFNTLSVPNGNYSIQSPR